MKVYFTASKNRQDRKKRIYQRIVDYFEKKEDEIFTVILSEHLPDFSDVSAKKLKEWHKEWSSFVRECDFTLVEASYPSTIHIGFEVGLMLSRGKPVALLHQKGEDPIFINNMHSTKLIKSEYEAGSLEEVLEWVVEEVSSVSNRRFTFNISSEIDEYLANVVRDQGISRSEYIRELIRREIEESS